MEDSYVPKSILGKQFLINFLSGDFFNSMLKYTIILKYGSLDFS